jgi:hypothetical protein
MSSCFLKLLIFLGTLLSLNVYSADKYCSNASSAKSYDIHLFNYTFNNESQKKIVLRSLNELKNKFEMGDRVRVFKHSPDAYSVQIDQCVPGCPEKGFFEGFLDATCSVQVANKDKVLFQQNFAKSVIEDLKKEPQDYDIFRSVQTLADFYNSNTRKANVYAAISMVPYKVDPSNKDSLDSLFVKGVNGLILPSTDFPPVTVIGSPPDTELRKFWIEIFKQKKVKFNLMSF